jgi:phytoene/squalene synthetase
MTTLTATMIEDAAGLDPDRTLATSFATPEARNGLISLILFNHEIARVADVVSEPGIGLIRLHWWREVVDQIFTGAPVKRQPVAEALAATVQRYTLPRTLLDGMIDARERDLESLPFAKDADLDAWLDAVSGNLIRLSFLVCGAGTLTSAHEVAARHAGAMIGRTVLLGSLGAWRGRNACWLPLDQQEGAGMRMVDGAPVWPDGANAGLQKALKHQVSLIAKHRKSANKALAELPADHTAALIHAALAPGIARKVAKSGDPFAPRDPAPLLARQLKLVMATAIKRL